jgi:hypothetical protein
VDAERQIRFALTPFFLYGSVLVGALVSGTISIRSVTALPNEALLAVTGALLASTLPIGFLLGAITILVLRGSFRIFTKMSYEAVLDQATWDRIWKQLETTVEYADKRSHYAAVILDHELMSEGAHGWMTRRWTSFNMSANACIALLVAHFVGYLLGVPQTWEWWAGTVVSVGILGLHSAVAWSQTMNMLEFQSHRTLKPRERPATQVSKA